MLQQLLQMECIQLQTDSLRINFIKWNFQSQEMA